MVNGVPLHTFVMEEKGRLKEPKKNKNKKNNLGEESVLLLRSYLGDPIQ